MTPVWRKSSHSGSSSGQSDCVEVAPLASDIGVRDSKAPKAPHLAFSAADWRRFAGRVKRGEHDLACPIPRRNERALGPMRVEGSSLCIRDQPTA